MYYSPALVIAFTACAAATDHDNSPCTSSNTSVASSSSFMHMTSSGSSMMIGTGSMSTVILPSSTPPMMLSTNAIVEIGTVTLSQTIYVTRTVSSYITYCPGPTSFAVQNITYTVAEAMNVTVACPTGCVIYATGNPGRPTVAAIPSAVAPFSNNTAPFRNTTVACPKFNRPCPIVTNPAGVTCLMGRPCPTPQAGMQRGVDSVGSSTTQGTSFESSNSEAGSSNNSTA